MKHIRVSGQRIVSKGSKFMRGIVVKIDFNSYDDTVVTVKYKTIPDKQYQVY